MAFQGYEQTLSIPFPYKGINIANSNDPTTAKYIQNLILGDNNTGKVRYGTNFEADFAFDETRFFRNIIHGTSFLKIDGTYENLIYTTYITPIPYITTADNVIVAATEVPNVSLITFDITDLDNAHKIFLKARIFEGVYFRIIQAGLIEGADIFNVLYPDDNTITFNLPFAEEFFNDFVFWYERAGIYKKGENNLFVVPALKDDLDPNVIISSINYQNNLLIANGVDPVQVYNGDTISDLMGSVSLVLAGAGEVTTVGEDGNAITFHIHEAQLDYYTAVLINGLQITLVSDAVDQVVNITNIVFAEVADGIALVTITCSEPPIAEIRNILYKKRVPPFNYLAVGHNRLWALAEGRPYFEQFRAPNLCQKVYYAAKIGSAFDWFNEETRDVGFIDLSENNDEPENIEVIRFFQGAALFIGRHTTQLWLGDDPTELEGFRFNRVFPLGIMQKTLCQEMPNNLAIISNFGQSYSFYLNEFGHISFIPNFVAPVRDYFESQLSLIGTDRDYREMTSFYYPYNDLIGIKIKNECIVFQNKNEGYWAVFSENFADAKSYFYNKLNKTLYLGMKQGTLLSYGDKIINQSHTDYDLNAAIEKKISWRIIYSWIAMPTTWHNAAMFLSVTSLQEMVVNVRICENNDESEPIDSSIDIIQMGAQFDIGAFGIARFAMQSRQYPYRSIRFNGESFMLEFNGFVEDVFILDKIILAGGTNNAN